MHSFQGLRAVDVLEEFKLEEKGFKLRAGEPPANLPHAPGQLQAARMLFRRLQEAFEASAQVRRAADVRLGVRLRAIKCEDRGTRGQLIQRGLGVCRVEGESFKFNWHCHRIHAPHE